MMSNEIQQYFEVNSRSWLDDAYKKSGYNYPVGLQRLRIISSILSEHGSDGQLIDFGCGGGDLCLAASKLGYVALGVDMSRDMLEIAQRRVAESNEEIRSKISFIQGEFAEAVQQVAESTFDIVTAMGFIGYLDSDDDFFSRVTPLMNQNGKVIVSCRNRLFNMVNGSKYTTKEIENGTAAALIAEMEELYTDIPEEASQAFVSKLSETVEWSSGKPLLNQSDLSLTEQPFSGEVEARQHTPKQLLHEAAKYGLKRTALYGVHPHIVSPRLNRLLPPQLYNQLSDCLNAFESHPVSLTWSSVFISVFEKEDV